MDWRWGFVVIASAMEARGKGYADWKALERGILRVTGDQIWILEIHCCRRIVLLTVLSLHSLCISRHTYRDRGSSYGG